jgi:hypothetical protein
MSGVQKKVRCSDSREEVYGYLCRGADTGMKAVVKDPVAFRVTLKSGAGVLSRGDTVECTVYPAPDGCSVLLEGKPSAQTNAAADLRGTMGELAASLILKFGGDLSSQARTQG